MDIYNYINTNIINKYNFTDLYIRNCANEIENIYNLIHIGEALRDVPRGSSLPILRGITTQQNDFSDSLVKNNFQNKEDFFSSILTTTPRGTTSSNTITTPIGTTLSNITTTPIGTTTPNLRYKKPIFTRIFSQIKTNYIYIIIILIIIIILYIYIFTPLLKS
jgi:hypothetical protein